MIQRCYSELFYYQQVNRNQGELAPFSFPHLCKSNNFFRHTCNNFKAVPLNKY
jgi:hypothetical protein